MKLSKKESRFEVSPIFRVLRNAAVTPSHKRRITLSCNHINPQTVTNNAERFTWFQETHIQVLHDSSFWSGLVTTQKSRLRLLDDSRSSISRPNFTAIESSLLYYSVVLVQQGSWKVQSSFVWECIYACETMCSITCSFIHTHTHTLSHKWTLHLPPPCSTVYSTVQSPLYTVKVKRHNVVRGGPLSWIPGMRFTLCKFCMSISLAMACSLRLFA